MEPARIAKDRSRLLFFNHRIFHFSPTALASAWNFYHTTPVAHTESSTTLFNPFFQYQLQTRENYFSSPSNKCGANRVKRHACGPGQASRFSVHLPQYQLQTREQSFSAPSNKCGADRVKRHACNGKNGWPCTVSRLIHFQNKLYLGLTSKTGWSSYKKLTLYMGLSSLT